MKSGQKTVFISNDVTVSGTIDNEGMGALYVNNFGYAYRWVLNSGASTSAVGDIAFHGTGNTKGYFQEVFTAGQSGKGTAADTMAGVWCGVVASGAYGWIQCRGQNGNVKVEGTTAVAATDILKWVSGQLYVVKDVASGTAPTSGRNHIVALAAQAAAAVVLTACDIRCL